jgi:diguanylate cyclase (GGDEF)-like protein
VLFAGLGSFALLLLVGILFGRPILRTLGDFRTVASQAATDDMTGLANRRSLEEELVLEWRRAERIGSPLALVLADIDDFKAINDTWGHQAGDHVLRRVGQVFASGVRQVDFAARYGGEEFAVLVPETDLAGAIQLAERLRVALQEAVIELPSGHAISVTSSFGVAVKEGLKRPEQIVAAADENLYEAKRFGKNRVSPAPVVDAEPEIEIPPLERRRRTTKPAAPKPKPVAKAKKKPEPAAKPRRKPASKRQA